MKMQETLNKYMKQITSEVIKSKKKKKTFIKCHNGRESEENTVALISEKNQEKNLH